MEKTKQLLQEIEVLPYCRILEPTGLASKDITKHLLPEDLKEFLRTFC